jgi:hypothetical protein
LEHDPVVIEPGLTESRSGVEDGHEDGKEDGESGDDDHGRELLSEAEWGEPIRGQGPASGPTRPVISKEWFYLT